MKKYIIFCILSFLICGILNGYSQDTVGFPSTSITYSDADSTDISSNSIAEGDLAEYIRNKYSIRIKTIHNITADSTFSAADFNESVITNTSAAAPVVITLPSASAGLNGRFVANDADSLIILTIGNDSLFCSINWGVSNITSVAKCKSAIGIIAINDSVWVVSDSTGTWASF